MDKEQATAEEKAHEHVAGNEGAEVGTQGTREKSTIRFPYGGLEDAVLVAGKIAEHGGRQADQHQLAIWLGHGSPMSGTFRMRLSSARVFGLVEGDKNQLRLTVLGLRVVDPESQLLARVQAFLAVPLFKAIYDLYKGRPLPKNPIIEKEMIDLGVAKKQADRARQAFQSSAQYAGFLTYSKDRLILPGGVSEAMLSSSTTEPQKREAAEGTLPPVVQETQAISDANPLIKVLLKSLPAPGSEWAQEARQQWFATARGVFELIYRDKSAS